MQSQVTWSELWTVVGAIVFLGGIVSTILGWLWTKFTQHDKELAEFKLQVAQNYVTEASLVKIETRLTAAIDRLGDKVEKAMERIAHIAAER
jgi:hypothetical protein